MRDSIYDYNNAYDFGADLVGTGLRQANTGARYLGEAVGYAARNVRDIAAKAIPTSTGMSVGGIGGLAALAPIALSLYGQEKPATTPTSTAPKKAVPQAATPTPATQRDPYTPMFDKYAAADQQARATTTPAKPTTYNQDTAVRGASVLDEGMPADYWQRRASAMGLDGISLRDMRAGVMDQNDPFYYSQANVAARNAVQPDYSTFLSSAITTGALRRQQAAQMEAMRNQGALAQVREGNVARAQEGAADRAARQSEGALDRSFRQSEGTAEREARMKLEQARITAEAPSKAAYSQLAAAQARSALDAITKRDELAKRFDIIINDPRTPAHIREEAQRSYMSLFLPQSTAKSATGREEQDPQAQAEAVARKALAEQAVMSMTPEQLRAAQQRMAQGQPVLNGMAEGGPVIGAAPDDMMRYREYVQAAASAGVPPLPYNRFAMMTQQMQQRMNTSPVTGYAEGGEVETPDTMAPVDMTSVPVAGKQVFDGTGAQGIDTIPAVIDGAAPAALNSGEFVIPADVVKLKGTEFFDKLIQSARGMKSNGNVLR